LLLTTVSGGYFPDICRCKYKIITPGVKYRLHNRQETWSVMYT